VATLNGLFAVTLHASKDDITPVIKTVRVTNKTFIATDRYSVGQWEHTPDAPDSDFSLIIPKAAAEWLTKQTPKVLGFTEYALSNKETGASIEFAHDSIIISYDGDILAVTRFAVIGGNFPPVERLLANAVITTDATPVSLNPAFLERFTKGCVRIDKKGVVRISLTKTENPAKPGPVFIEFGEHFTGLLQPNHLLR
jgi:hypothetical protein